MSTLRIVSVIALLSCLAACEKEPIVLLCNPIETYDSKVAIRIYEDKSAAQLLDPITLAPLQDNPLRDVYISPTLINITEEDKANFWLIDRASGKLSRNNPRRDYFCGSGRRF